MRHYILFLFVFSFALLPAQQFQWNTPTTQAKTPQVVDETQMDERGKALYYANYLEGNPTATGELYDPNLMTAAHKNLPLGTIVKVSRMDNGLSTTVRINDRGAYCDGCIIDLSLVAAKQIDLIGIGNTDVYLTVIGYSKNNPPTPTEFVRANQNSGQLTARGLPNSYNYNQTPAQYNSPTVYNQPTESQSNRAINTQEKKPVIDLSMLRQNTTTVNTTNTKGVTVNAPVTSNTKTIPSNTNGAYAIQLASYGNITNAERHLSSLEEKGFDFLFITSENTAEGKTLNRVMVAPFASNDEAQVYLQDLGTYHQMKGIVVRMSK